MQYSILIAAHDITLANHLLQPYLEQAGFAMLKHDSTISIGKRQPLRIDHNCL